MVEHETKDDEATKEVSAEEPKAMMPTKTKSEVTVDADTGVTTVEEIEEIDDATAKTTTTITIMMIRVVARSRISKSNLRMNSTKKRRNISQTRNKLKKSKRLGQRPKRFSQESGKFLNSVSVDQKMATMRHLEKRTRFWAKKKKDRKRRKLKT